MHPFLASPGHGALTGDAPAGAPDSGGKEENANAAGPFCLAGSLPHGGHTARRPSRGYASASRQYLIARAISVIRSDPAGTLYSNSIVA